MTNFITTIGTLIFILNAFHLNGQNANTDSWLFLEAGTPITVTSHIDISAKKRKKNQQLCLYVAIPIVTKDQVVIPSGTPVYFKVSKIRKPKGAGEGGQMEIIPQYLKLSNGGQIALSNTPFTIIGANKEEESYLAMDITSESSSLFYGAQADYEKNLAQSSENLNTYLEPSGVNFNHVGDAVALLAPLAGLLVKGGHATLPKGVGLEVYVEVETPVKVSRIGN